MSRSLAVLFGVGAFYYGLFGGEWTVSEVRELRAVVETEASVLDALRAELDSLRAVGDSLVDDPWAIERVARERYGFIRPGEMLFRFVDAPPDASSSKTG